jgi:cytochrome c
MRRWTRSVMIAVAAAALVVPAAAEACTTSAKLAWSPTTSPGAYGFGTLNDGQTSSQVFTLTNSGRRAPGVLKVRVSGSAAFSLTADGCSRTSVGPRHSCDVTVEYSPTTAGESDTATLRVTSKHHATAHLSLTGIGASEGTADLILSPGTHTTTNNFGVKSYHTSNGEVAGSWSQTFTVTNDGTATSNHLSFTNGGDPDFSLTSDTCTGTALAPNGTCTFDITFTSPGCPSGPEPFVDFFDVMAQDNGSAYIALDLSGTCSP